MDPYEEYNYPQSNILAWKKQYISCAGSQIAREYLVSYSD